MTFIVNQIIPEDIFVKHLDMPYREMTAKEVRIYVQNLNHTRCFIESLMKILGQKNVPEKLDIENLETPEYIAHRYNICLFEYLRSPNYYYWNNLYLVHDLMHELKLPYYVKYHDDYVDDCPKLKEIVDNSLNEFKYPAYDWIRKIHIAYYGHDNTLIKPNVIEWIRLV